VDRFDAGQAWELLKSAQSVTVAKGKKFQRFDQVANEKAAILQAAMGPSGNLRAPTFRVGREFVIGFNPELYADWVK
jgi:hypothetical protein